MKERKKGNGRWRTTDIIRERSELRKREAKGKFLRNI